MKLPVTVMVYVPGGVPPAPPPPPDEPPLPQDVIVRATVMSSNAAKAGDRRNRMRCRAMNRCRHAKRRNTDAPASKSRTGWRSNGNGVRVELAIVVTVTVAVTPVVSRGVTVAGETEHVAFLGARVQVSETGCAKAVAEPTEIEYVAAWPAATVAVEVVPELTEKSGPEPDSTTVCGLPVAP